MSKELEALELLDDYILLDEYDRSIRGVDVAKITLTQALTELETLRAKEIPTKPEIVNDKAFCKCGYQVFIDCDINYCSHCGKKLDWEGLK